MNGGYILLVEDEKAVSELNRRYLETAGYQVSAARTIKEARAAVW